MSEAVMNTDVFVDRSLLASLVLVLRLQRRLVCVTTVWSACIFNTFPCFCHAVFLVDSISSSLGNSSPLTSSADCTTLLPVVVPKPVHNTDVYSGEKC